MAFNVMSIPTLPKRDTMFTGFLKMVSQRRHARLARGTVGKPADYARNDTAYDLELRERER